jgi:hypothetical protein
VQIIIEVEVEAGVYASEQHQSMAEQTTAKTLLSPATTAMRTRDRT